MKIELNNYQINSKKNFHPLRSSLKAIFKNYIFILFSFVNMFIPFYATIISALIGPHGSLNVTVVGLATSFISIFNQFLFLVALTMIFTLNRDVMFHPTLRNIDKKTITFIMFVYSSISMILFIGSALLYIRYSTLYQGFYETFSWALQFVFLLAPTFIINGFIYLNMIYKLEVNKAKSIIIFIIFFVMHLIFLPIFYLCIPWGEQTQLVGLGLGFLVSSLITLLVLSIFNFKKHQIISLKVDWNTFKYFIAKSANFIGDFLIATIMKGFLVMIIGISLRLVEKPTLPSLMVAKILWYNSLFFCGFFGDGLFYAVEYSKMKIIANDKNQNTDPKVLFVLSLITFIVTLIICVIFDFSSMALSDTYSINEVNAIAGFKPNGQDVKNYLYCPTKKVINPITGNKTTTFALGYLTIYHCLINSFKIISIKQTKINQSFSLMKLFAKFIMLVIVMAFISIMGCSFNDPKYSTYLDTFNGLDTFSFALLVISIIMFVLGNFSFLKMFKKNK